MSSPGAATAIARSMYATGRRFLAVPVGQGGPLPVMNFELAHHLHPRIMPGVSTRFAQNLRGRDAHALRATINGVKDDAARRDTVGFAFRSGGSRRAEIRAAAVRRGTAPAARRPPTPRS